MQCPLLFDYGLLWGGGTAGAGNAISTAFEGPEEERLLAHFCKARWPQPSTSLVQANVLRERSAGPNTGLIR